MIALQVVPSTVHDGAYEHYVGGHIKRKERLGYLRFHPDVWDVPTWALPVMRAGGRLVIAKAPVNLERRDTVFGSVLDALRDEWVDTVYRNLTTPFILGGYTEPIIAPNVQWYPNTAVLQTLPRQHAPYPITGKVHGARVTLSRGCLNNCAFCTVPHGAVTELEWPEIIAQLDGGEFGWVYVDDKTFGQAGNWTLLDRIRESVPVDAFVVQTTANEVLRHNVAQWARFGVRAVEIGVESFNDSVLYAQRKPHSTKQIERAVHKLADAGLLVSPNIIIGLDGETDSTYDRTVMWMASVPNLGWFTVQCFADYSVPGAREDVLPPERATRYRKIIYELAGDLMARR